ncbi:MAG: redoxin domain-containing protein [Phycisphaerales bacterium]|nr:redoxin domain-containing protein [Phycisphaerales bacterium]
MTSPAWMRYTLMAAGAWNLLWGAAAVLFPLWFFQISHMEPPRYPAIWQCLGMVIGVYGIGYIAAAGNPARHWPIILVGLLGKVFGPIGFVYTAARGDLAWSFGWMIVLNDLVWWIPFVLILWHATRANVSIPDPESPALPPATAMGHALDQSGMSLLDLSHQAPTLVVFLRHLGCTFCREMLGDVSRHRATIEADGTRIAFVHMSREDDRADRLFRAYELADVPRFSDPQRELYRSFELPRGSFLQLFGPRVAWRGVLATVRGHRAAGLQGDGLQLAGAFLIHNGAIVRAFHSADAADRPDYCTLAADPA